MASEIIDCIVVGAGAAGLTAAYRLRQAGLSVRVLEKEKRVGGRMKGGRWHDVSYDQGAQFLVEHGSPIIRLADELGIEAIPVVYPGGPVAIFEGSTLKTADSIASFADYARMRGWAEPVASEYESVKSIMTAWRAILEGEDEARSRMLHDSLDRRSYKSVMADVGAAVRDEFFAVIREVVSHDPDLVSGVQGVLSAAKVGVVPYLCVPSGAHSIWIELADRIADRITLSAEVRSIRDQGDHVEIDYVENGVDCRLLARYCIVATTADQVLALVEGLPTSKRKALEAITYGPFVTCNFLTSETEEQAWDRVASIQVNGSDTFGLVVHQSYLARRAESIRGRGSAIWTLATEAAATRLFSLSDDRIAEETRAELLKIFPALDGKIDQILVTRWENGIPAMTVGGYSRLADLRVSVGRVHFCGDYLGDSAPEINPAIETAEQAAAEIAKALSPTPGG